MDENKFAIMHIEKYKTKVAMTKSYNHNYRRLACRTKRIDGMDNFANVDLDRIYLDKELVSSYSGQDYAIVWQKRFDSMAYYNNHTFRKDGVRALDIILSMSSEMIDKVDISSWANENVKWLQATFGSDNVLSAMLHLDELTPHIHAFVLPVQDKRLCAKAVLGGPAKMRSMQTSYAKSMEKFGLERGITGTHVKHEKLKRMHGEIGKSLEQAEKAVIVQRNKLGMIESAEAYALRIHPMIDELIVKNKRLQRENERLKKVQSQVIEKDKYYGQIEGNMEHYVDVEKKAALWDKLIRVVNDHPQKEVQDFYKNIYIKRLNGLTD